MKLLTRTPKQLKALRKSYGLSQKKWAKKIGIPMRTWCDWEYGVKVPSASGVRLIEYIETFGFVQGWEEK